MTFEEALRSGRSRIAWLGIFERKGNYLLSLEELRNEVPPSDETYLGIREIPVNKIIGSESRSQDFSFDYYPVHQWMEPRWKGVQSYLLSPGSEERITVYEYGGKYFVRDGNHRVSVAKTNKIDFLTAEVTKLNIPVQVPDYLKRTEVDLFRAKYELHQACGLFDILPEEEFSIKSPENWRFLKRELLVYNKSWFERKHGREPDSNKELIESWYINLYKNAISHIREHSLTYLYPNKAETDIFCDIIRLWNSYDDPDSIWFQEIFDMHRKRAEKRFWYKRLLQGAGRFIQGYRRSAEDERRLFLQYSQLDRLIPDYRLPEGKKKWYRYLRYQLLWDEFKAVKKRIGRVPYLQELTPQWYNNLFLPSIEAYENTNTTLTFPKFYQRFISCLGKKKACSPYGHKAEEIRKKAEHYAADLENS